MDDNAFHRIKLTHEDMLLVAQAGAELRRIEARLADSYAAPEEREAVGLRINPETAHVFYVIAQTLDPYGDDPQLPDELRQTGREFFAVDPEERVAVHFHDLPEATREALAEMRHAANAEGWRWIAGVYGTRRTRSD